jgi:hypothetical protein
MLNLVMRHKLVTAKQELGKIFLRCHKTKIKLHDNFTGFISHAILYLTNILHITLQNNSNAAPNKKRFRRKTIIQCCGKISC